MYCSTSVDGVKYSWHRIDGDLPSNSKNKHCNTFTICKATPHDEGEYYCKASKSKVSIKSRTAVVTVDGKERFIDTDSVNFNDIYRPIKH